MLSSIIIIAILADSGEGRRFLCPSSSGRNPKSVFYEGDFVLLVVEGNFACSLDSEIRI